jgi:hypothetical protein
MNTSSSSKIAALTLLGLCAVTTNAHAQTVRAGSWPEHDKSVSLSFDGSKEEALRKLADQAGWSLVSNLELGAKSVHLKLADVPADVALEAILDGEDAVNAKRTGNVLTLARASKVQEGVAPAPASSAKAEEHGDLSIHGQSITIRADETYDDVSVLGGNADVYGNITGDVVVTGGRLTLHDGARVKGDATAIGGTLHVEKNVHIDGNVGVVGGVYTRDDGAVIKGDVVQKPSEVPRTFVERVREGSSNVLSSFAILFMIGCILIALADERLTRLRSEIAMKPMRSAALGLVSFLGAILGIVFLCVTVIGIPFALIAAIMLTFGIVAGEVALSSVVGEALSRHKTQNPYVHLALGAALVAIAGALPWVGGILGVLTACVALGSFVSTRAAGLVKQSAAVGTAPYRSTS